MRKALLLTFNTHFTDRDTLTRYLDAHPRIYNWKAHLPFGVFVVTDLTPKELREILRVRFELKGPARLFITELSADKCDGWMQPGLWDMIRNPLIPPNSET